MFSASTGRIHVVGSVAVGAGCHVCSYVGLGMLLPSGLAALSNSAGGVCDLRSNVPRGSWPHISYAARHVISCLYFAPHVCTVPNVTTGLLRCVSAQNTVSFHAGVLLGRLGRFQVPVRVLRGLRGEGSVGARRLRQGDILPTCLGWAIL